MVSPGLAGFSLCKIYLFQYLSKVNNSDINSHWCCFSAPIVNSEQVFPEWINSVSPIDQSQLLFKYYTTINTSVTQKNYTSITQRLTQVLQKKLHKYYTKIDTSIIQKI